MNFLKKISKTSENSRIIIKNSIGAFLIRGLGIILSLFSAPVFIHYFNNKEVMGVWFTLVAVLTWFLNFDLGIGNGIRNQLVYDIANKDYKSAKTTISSGLVTIAALGVFISFIGSFLICSIDLNSFFNVSKEILSEQTLKITVIAIFVAIMLRFVLSTVSSIFYAIQKSAINNLLSLIVAFLQFLFVLIFRFDNVEEALVYLAVSYLFISNIPSIIAGAVVFSKELKFCRPSIKNISKERTRKIFNVGTVFFLCQILYMLIVNTNEILITNLYGGQYTTEYTFYHKITNIVALVITLAMTPIWSVVTKAQAENNYLWLSKLYKKIKLAGLLAFILQFLIIPFIPFIFDIWLGEGVVNVDTTTSISFALFAGFFVYSSLLSTITNGMYRMKLQFICFTLGVIAKFSIDLLLYKYISDWNLIVWSTVIAFVPYVVCQHIDLNIYFKRKLK